MHPIRLVFLHLQTKHPKYDPVLFSGRVHIQQNRKHSSLRPFLRGRAFCRSILALSCKSFKLQLSKTIPNAPARRRLLSVPKSTEVLLRDPSRHEL